MTKAKKESVGRSLRTVTYKLKYPTEWGQQTIESLEFKRPKGRDIRHLTKDVSTGTLMDLAQKVVVEDVTPKFFDDLDSVDCLAICEVVGDFLGGGQ